MRWSNAGTYGSVNIENHQERTREEISAISNQCQYDLIINQVTYILYLSLRMVNEKQQEMTFVLSVSGLLRRHEVNTAFWPASKAMLPYFYNNASSVIWNSILSNTIKSNPYLPIIYCRLFCHHFIYTKMALSELLDRHSDQSGKLFIALINLTSSTP